MTLDPRLQASLRTLDRAGLGLAGEPDRVYQIAGALPPRPRLAVVGSRAAHRRFLDLLPPALASLRALGWSLVSGGALGIDGGAHQAALAQAVPQLAVLPCGSDQLYPPGHAGLFAHMLAAAEAAILFAHPPGTPTVRGMFASRNAIVVGLADAVLVVEAGLRSGSMITGKLAQRSGVPLAAVAGSRGCGALIAAGARALPEPARGGSTPSHDRFAAALTAWLNPGAGGERKRDPLAGWPAGLRWLGQELLTAGPAGLCIDASADPTAAIVGLCEAELLGLVSEAAPGRWVAL